MNKSAKDIFKYVTGIAGSIITLDSYRRSVLNDNNNELLNEAKKLHKLALEKEASANNMANETADLYSNLSTKILGSEDRLKDLLSNLNVSIDKIKKLKERTDTESLVKTEGTEIVEFQSKILNEVRSLHSDILRLMSDSSSKSSFLDNPFDDLRNYLSTLSTPEIGAVAHLFIAVTIYFCVINIMTAYFGDSLIIYFKLESKYPKLAR